MLIITTNRSSRPLATPIHPTRFCAEYPLHASCLPFPVLSSVRVSMRRRAIHKRFSPCGETCLKQGNCQAVPPGDGTSCSCGNPDGVRVCLAKERCPSGDLSEFNGDLGLCTIVASALSPETLTDTDTATSTNTATTGTDTHTASLTSGPMGSPTGTPKALPSSENLSPTQTADPAETNADTLTSTSGILPLTSSSLEDISSASPAPSSPLSRPISTYPSASSPIIASPNTIFPATATVTQTSPAPHEPPPTLIIALSASFGVILLVALMTAVTLIYRRRRHRAVAHDPSQAGLVAMRSSREDPARDKGTLAIAAKAAMSASNSTLVVATHAAAVPFGPTPADVDTSYALFPRPCDVPITPSTASATFSCAPDLGAHDVPATTIGVEEPGKARATEQREREPPNNPLVAPPAPHSIPPDSGVHEDQFGMSQTVSAHAHAYVHRERRFVTVLMEVDSDGGSEGGYDTERPPPYQPRPRGVAGDPS